jgi:N-acetylglucosaminyldiphosphoundecaprenol N-acetyl-beta-D-mannosaminyltransferase
MIDEPKRDVCGVAVHVCDYEAVASAVIAAASEVRPLAVTPIATHGIMLAHDDPELRYRLNRLDYVVPDGQPVRWALNGLHGAGLADRVAGPDLMLHVMQAAARAGLPIFFLGSTAETLARLRSAVEARFPGLGVAGTRPSRFRALSPEEEHELIREIEASGAKMVFVGFGCPRQEVWLYEFRDRLAMPLLAFGAAFDFHAGVLKRPGRLIQRLGLEWAYRLLQEPRRLWHRYIVLGGRFVGLVARDRLSRRRAGARADSARAAERAPAQPLRYG